VQLSKRERRFISLCHRVALCELGVDPRRPSTWPNAKHVHGYDYAFGWLRDPGNLLSQLYVATHPKVYRLWVGFYARLLLQHHQRHKQYLPGIKNEKEAIRCCIELRLQLYNTKLALPKAATKSFSHLDCEWTRAGAAVTPAPQCLLVTSPQEVDGQEVFDARFVDVEAEVIHHDHDQSHNSSGRERTVHGYQLPRTHKGACVGRASKEPPGTDFTGTGKGPKRLEIGDILMWGHLVAHEFTQHGTVPSTGEDSVPLGLTRTSEYPMLVSPWIHGVPHQSIDEVLAALLTGTPPRRWAHVYTGNLIPCSPLFRPALPPLPATPSTPLARALVGIDDFVTCPQATAWLMRSIRGHSEAAAEEAVKEATLLHKRLMLTEMLAPLRRRLRRLATLRDTDLIVQANVSAYAQRSPLACPVAEAISAAARAAIADPELQPRKRQRTAR